jgi:uroporphyrin-III C-methyltransferase
VIASATTPQERILVATVEKLAAAVREQNIEPPAIVVIGEIVKMRDRLLGKVAAVVKDTM